ncbi:sugar ABC transporter permease [Pseudonocardiaceae bacterium YIM PH 21723]|nr:sugar ABC transporter permease [Pseudonocardiaceae bacterium YIM PH 21723]
MRRRNLAPYLFLAPNLVLFAVFVLYPALNGVNISLYDSTNGRTFRFVGTRNYRELVGTDAFREAITNTAVFVACFVVLATVVAVGLAALLQRGLPGSGFYRAVFFVPVLLSPIVVGLVWSWLLERRGGLVNTALGAVGLPEPGWLIDPSLTMGVSVFVAVWLHVGLYTLIVLAALRAIDPRTLEAATMDGASARQRFWHVTLPQIQPSVLVVVIVSTVDGFKTFDLLYTLTGGGPVGATTLLLQYVYEQAFKPPIRYGLAAAGSVVLFLVILAVTVVQFVVARRRELL